MKVTVTDALSPAAYRRRATVFGGLTVLVAAASLYMGFDPSMLFTEFHYVIDLFGNMAPPNMQVFYADETISMAVLETVSMSFLGTLTGGIIAMLLAFLAAENTMPSRVIRFSVRLILSFFRVIPPLFIILVFVAAVGLGPFAGMLSLILYTVGTFGALFAEIVENTEPAPADAVYSVGATRGQVIRHVILPQVLPSFTANFFFAFDINIRMAISLGIFGGGGIGFQLFAAMRVLRYHDALALILLTMALILASERISDFIRSRLLNSGRLK